MAAPLALALIHYPVLDKHGDVITSAVTNLDIHDIARTARTYGVARYYLVTPAAEQVRVVERILAHWQTGYGASYNPDRAEALALVRVVADVAAALADFAALTHAAPLPVLTGARRTDGLSVQACRALCEQQPLLLLFGTGWGLADSFFAQNWPVLEPVQGCGDYNHLPVRSAVAIILDRLLAAPSAETV